MKIIKGHDYYDSAAMFGIDKSIVFVRNERETTEFKLKCFESSSQYDDVSGYSYIRLHKNNKFPFDYKLLKVIVAGKLYVGIVFREELIGRYDMVATDRFHFFWDTKEFHQFFDKHLDGRGYYGSGYFNHVSLFEQGSKKLIELGEQEISKTDLDVLIKNKITIATRADKYGRASLGYRVDHTGLRDIQLYKILPAPIIRQNIEQWVGGTLTGHDRPMVEVSNDVKIHKAGFDKYSFRKQKN